MPTEGHAGARILASQSIRQHAGARRRFSFSVVLLLLSAPLLIASAQVAVADASSDVAQDPTDVESFYFNCNANSANACRLEDGVVRACNPPGYEDVRLLHSLKGDGVISFRWRPGGSGASLTMWFRDYYEEYHEIELNVPQDRIYFRDRLTRPVGHYDFVNDWHDVTITHEAGILKLGIERPGAIASFVATYPSDQGANYLTLRMASTDTYFCQEFDNISMPRLATNRFDWRCVSGPCTLWDGLKFTSGSGEIRSKRTWQDTSSITIGYNAGEPHRDDALYAYFRADSPVGTRHRVTFDFVANEIRFDEGLSGAPVGGAIVRQNLEITLNHGYLFSEVFVNGVGVAGASYVDPTGQVLGLAATNPDWPMALKWLDPDGFA